MLALYASAVVGFGTVGWLGYDFFAKKELSTKNVARTAIGLSAYFALWIPGAKGAFKDKNKLENKVK